MTGFGGAAVAFRQQPESAPRSTRPRVFVNTIPEAFSPDAGKFGSARIADELPAGAPSSPLGAPSVGATSNGVLLIGLGAGQASLAANGNDTAIAPAARLDDGRTGVDGGAASGARRQRRRGARLEGARAPPSV